MASIVSERYAYSLYDVAKEHGRTQAIFDALRVVTASFAENPALMQVLTTPSIGLAEKKAVLTEIFSGRIDDFLLNFLLLITEKRRISLLSEMAEAYQQQFYTDEGLCEVHAVTAAPLSEALAQRLQEKMCTVTGKKVVLHTHVDPTILGGIIVKTDNRQIDNSVKTQLSELAQSFMQIIA